MRGGSAPGFWWRPSSLTARLLSPVAAVYGAIAGRTLDRGERAETGLPVLCIGNFTAGGGGKTPTALALGAAALAAGRRPGFLSRGHGGRLGGPLLVDPARHTAADVGDEPMLLASLAPTAIAVDRKQGARLLSEAGCDLVLMDDGFQSARLRTDLALLVIDAGRGLGNGRVIPAGPLRAPLGVQLRHADALLVIGDGLAGAAALLRLAPSGKPVFRATLVPEAQERFAGQRFLAFAGIADPGKFYRSLENIGAIVAETRDFPDHHDFTAGELAELNSAAARGGLTLVTTRKDAVRLAGGGADARAMLDRIAVLDIQLAFDDAAAAGHLVGAALNAFARRQAG